MRKEIGFWKVSEPYGELSNWYYTVFSIRDITFICAEQALMYHKALLFNDKAAMKKVMTLRDNREIKALGREVKGFRQDVWDKYKFVIMELIVYRKFVCNERLRQILLGTGDAYLYEDSPFDAIWGVGKDHKGQNLLGKALMSARTRIREEIAENKLPKEEDRGE